MVSSTSSPGTTCCIAAAKALQHLEDNLMAITAIFSAYQIPLSDYRLCAGFDEGLIQDGLGHLGQIHVLLHSEPHHIKPMLQKLEFIFSPFSAIIFTKGTVHRIPSSTTEFNKITWNSTSDFLITKRSNPQLYPTAVSLSHIPNSTFGPGESSGQQNSNNSSKEQAPPNSNQVNESQETDSDSRCHSPNGETSGGAASPVEISFLATCNLHPLLKQPQPLLQEPCSKCSYQLTSKGTLVITRTPESQEHPQMFATCHVLFTELETGTFPSADNLAYGHIHTTVIIDSQQELADITGVKPQRTPQYYKDLKLLSEKDSWTSASAVYGISSQPQGSSHAVQMPKCSTSSQMTTNISRINNMDGFVAWCYHVSDGFSQVGEKAMAFDKLPQAQFEFIGKTDTPASPPDHTDVEVSTYWSVLPRNGGTENSLWNWPSTFWLNKPSYSNVCQIVTLKIPSDLPQGHYDYQARLAVFPQQSNLHKMGYMTHNDPTNVASSTVMDSKHDFETASSVYDVRWRDTILELTSFRKVQVPYTLVHTEGKYDFL